MPSKYLKDAKRHSDEFKKIHTYNADNIGELKFRWGELMKCVKRAGDSKSNKSDVPEIQSLVHEINPLMNEVDAKARGKLDGYIRLKFDRMRKIFPIKTRKASLEDLLSEALQIQDQSDDSLEDVIGEIKAKLQECNND